VDGKLHGTDSVVQRSWGLWAFSSDHPYRVFAFKSRHDLYPHLWSQ